MAKILIVDDERAVRQTLRDILEYQNYTVEDVDNGIKGLSMIRENHYDLVLCDIRMSRMSGMDLLAASLVLQPKLPFIMISAYGNSDTAAEASKKGAFDFIAKPPDLKHLLAMMHNALCRDIPRTIAVHDPNEVAHIKEIIGNSHQIAKIKATIDRVAATNARILITGENGSGKELVAHCIHEKSQRKAIPLVEVNCAAIPSELIESELFGHEKGAFTSAIKQRIGKFELAHSSTLFLDEIGDMSLSAQAKVLRALQEHKIMRVGGEKEIEVDVRIIAATNKDLHKEIAAGRFRIDLYHRINVIHIHVPPLSERKEDIPLLTHNFLQEICIAYGIPVKKMADAALHALKDLPWTGNIRELHNVVERLIILSDKTITEEDVKAFANPLIIGQIATHQPPTFMTDFNQFKDLQEYRDYAERAYIMFKLKKNNWNISKAAEDMAIQRSHLYSKIEKFNLKRE